MYVSEEIKVSLVSKDCLIRLKVLDPSHFLSDNEVRSFSVNQLDEEKESSSKLSDCEKSFFKKTDGSMGCMCEIRTPPPDFDEEFYDIIFEKIIKTKQDDINATLEEILKRRFKGSAMNLCQTQQLPMMKVPDMMVELKDEFKNVKAKQTTRIIPVPLALVDQTRKDLDNAVRMGILENI